ncbi:MAG: hypothetical protein Q9208_004491 [Pyrenodesmia sp. 3 TL-2023]
MRFQVPADSHTSLLLQRFLNQSLRVDEDLVILSLRTGQMGTLAFRQHQLTNGTLRSIRSVQYYGWFEWLRIDLLGISTQESALQQRLAEHFRLLSDKITDLDGALRKLLQDTTALASTAGDIRQSSLEDRQRLLSEKGEEASQIDWVVRVLIQVFKLPEPESLAQISRNLELAENILEWSQDVVAGLERMLTHLRHANIYINSLMDIIRGGGTIKWSLEDKDRELIEFLAQTAEGVRLLEDSNAARSQLQRRGHL